MNWKDLIAAKDFDELVTEARLRLGSLNSGITNWVIGGVLRTLVELCCYGLAGLYALLVKVLPMGFVKFATGKWLDLWADSVNIERRKAKKAVGFVVFGRDEPGGVVKIPARSIVKTETTASGQELRYFTETEIMLQTGEMSALVPVIAEIEGAFWNVGASYIRVLVTHIPGIDWVRNEADWLTSEGIDEEEDESLRNRYYLRWEELSTGSTAGAYESWTLRVYGVIDVKIVDDHPRGDGTVDVIITGPNGLPSEALKTDVKSYIDTRRPLCSDTLVKGPDEKRIDLDIVLYLHPQRGDELEIKQAAEAVLQDFFVKRKGAVIEAQKIGQDFVSARLIRYLMGIESVVNAKIISPAEDLLIEKSEMAMRGNLAIGLERVIEV